MGPRATVEFEKRLIDLFAGSDQAIPPIITINDGAIPDRTQFLQNIGEDPTIRLTKNAKLLMELGATIICMPCNTAHADRILGRIQDRISLPIINMPESCLNQVIAEGCGSALILGTEGTKLSGIFEGRSEQLSCVYPNFLGQHSINQLIKDVKKGLPISSAQITELEKIIASAGADATILACTELSLIKDVLNKRFNIIDSLDVLARCAHERVTLSYTNLQEEPR
jgi:aspartate racemase